MKLYLDLDMEKCSACGACAVACMDQNDVDPAREMPFRSVYCVEHQTGVGVELQYASLSCMPLQGCPLCAGLPLRLSA